MTKKNKILVAGGITLLLGVGLILFFIGRSDNRQDTKYYSTLTGKEVSQADSELPIVGIMVENSPAARPQKGLAPAGVVFETVTEGGITRFLALYQEDTPDIVAPVRSLRTPFLDWGMGFNASFAHVGGSAEALQLVDERDASSLNQFRFPDPYFRSEDREPPHNMSVRTQDLRSLMEELGYGFSSVDSFSWVDNSQEEQVADGKSVDRLKLSFSSKTYEVEYRYNSDSQLYLRYLAGEPHVDGSMNQQLTAVNVVVLEGFTNSIDATGQGKVTVFTRGRSFEGEWRKDRYDASLALSDSQGDPILLNRGNTWIAALPGEGKLEIADE